jgi:orotate phosphoribosyltransferase
VNRVREDILALLRSRTGHFQLESGHHGDLWLELERLCLRVSPVEQLAAELAARLSGHNVDLVCGPLVEGAFVALLVASRLDVPFTYAERIGAPGVDALYGVRYRVPETLRSELAGKRVAIVNDVINAGSAVRGTFTDLVECGAHTVAIGSLVVLGSWAPRFSEDQGVRLEALTSVPNRIWEPSACPLCAEGRSLDNPAVMSAFPIAG